MKDSPEAKLAAWAEDVYCQASLNEHENPHKRREDGLFVWRSVTIPDLAIDVM